MSSSHGAPSPTPHLREALAGPTGPSMATATTHHDATVNPSTGEVVREFDGGFAG